MMLRLGAIGTASSHLDHFARELDGDARIVRALRTPGDPAAAPPGIELHDDAARFLDSLDGVLILTRDGRHHREQALPLLARGLPIFVDKPLACDLRSATEVVAGGRVASFSALRFLPEIASLRAAGTPISAIRVPGDGASPHAGFWFHGIHGAELACALAGKCDVHDVAAGATGLRAHLRAPGQSFELTLDPCAATYEVHHADGISNLDVPAAYTLAARQLERFFAGENVSSAQEMLAPIELLEQVLSHMPAQAKPSLASLI
jgi:hypothetical protein